MREILFKGKSIDNGEWVEGDLFHNDDELFPMTMIGCVICSRNKHDGNIEFDVYALCEVDLETVGQYTGLKDKNGKRIFEGDIVRVDLEEPTLACVIGEVYYTNGCYMIRPISSALSLLAYRPYCTVIGNIHDNP